MLLNGNVDRRRHRVWATLHCGHSCVGSMVIVMTLCPHPLLLRPVVHLAKHTAVLNRLFVFLSATNSCFSGLLNLMTALSDRGASGLHTDTTDTSLSCVSVYYTNGFRRENCISIPVSACPLMTWKNKFFAPSACGLFFGVLATEM